MNIYRIEQEANNEYDTFDSAVVIAASAEDARHTHPGDGSLFREKDSDSNKFSAWNRQFGSWVSDPSLVKATRIGTVPENLDQTPQVVCASFNAG